MITPASKCECCNKEITNLYGSGRFCCASCARRFSTRAKRKEINEKVSNKLKGSSHNSTPQKIAKYKETMRKKKESKLVRMSDGLVLNITYKELEEYRKSHPICEICGKPEYTKHQNGEIRSLAIDHNHKTGLFRGLLCYNCNTRLGWLENHFDEAVEYLRSRGGIG